MSESDVSPIDVWLQHPTPSFLNEPMFESLLRWMGIEEVPDEIPFEMTLQAYGATDIEHGLLTAWHGPKGALLSNEEVAEFVDQSDGLFSGIGSVDLSKPMKAVEQVHKTIDDYGFVGIRVLPWLWERSPDHRSFYPVYAACVERDVPFCLQVGHTGPRAPSEYGKPIPHLDRVLLDFPELTVVAGHIGHPWTHQITALAYKYPNLYIDTSAYKPTRFPAEFVEYMNQTDCQKVMFGSNYPMLTPDDALKGLDELGLSEKARNRFLRNNAVEVFGLVTD